MAKTGISTAGPKEPKAEVAGKPEAVKKAETPVPPEPEPKQVDMGGEFDTVTALRDAWASGHALGPRLLLAGLVDGPGPASFGHVTAANPDEGRAAVRRYKDAGFQQMKLYSLLDRPTVAAVIEAAAIERGDHHRLRTWLAATALLGSTFVAGQVYEFTVFKSEGMGFTTSRSSSAFYTLTGFHGVHVTVGIIMLVSLLLLSLRGKIPEHRAESVETVGLYWHFVDVVWIVIFAVVYLIP
jgi:hypothetical protein